MSVRKPMIEAQAAAAYDRLAAMFPGTRSDNDLTADVWIGNLTGLDLDACRVTVDNILEILDFFPSWAQFWKIYQAAVADAWKTERDAQYRTEQVAYKGRGAPEGFWDDMRQVVEDGRARALERWGVAPGPI